MAIGVGIPDRYAHHRQEVATIAFAGTIELESGGFSSPSDPA
jgi:hypothetical protein